MQVLSGVDSIETCPQYLNKGCVGAIIAYQGSTFGQICEHVNAASITTVEICKHPEQQDVWYMRYTMSKGLKIRTVVNILKTLQNNIPSFHLIKLTGEEHIVITGNRNDSIKNHPLFKHMDAEKRLSPDSSYECKHFVNNTQANQIEDEVRKRVEKKEAEIRQALTEKFTKEKEEFEKELVKEHEEYVKEWMETKKHAQSLLEEAKKQLEKKETELQKRIREFEGDTPDDSKKRKIIPDLFANDNEKMEKVMEAFNSEMDQYRQRSWIGTLEFIKKIKRSRKYLKDTVGFFTKDIKEDNEENARKLIRRVFQYYHPDTQEQETSPVWKLFSEWMTKQIVEFKDIPYKRSGSISLFPL